MSAKNKQKFGFLKSLDAEKKQITAYVSTNEWDRTDERFAQGSFDVKDYMKNPVMLWAHDYKRPPIGKALQLSQDETGLLATMQFAPDQFSQDIFELYKGGFLSAFSVGFNPKADGYKLEPIDATRKGIVYTAVDLLEFSAVPVPANPGAVVSRELAEMATKALGEKAIMKVGDGDDAKFVIAPDAEPEPEEEPAKPDLETSLKSVIQLAKTAKGLKLPKQQLGLILTTMDLFKEIVIANQEGPSDKELADLRACVKALSETIKGSRPDAEETVKQVMRQLERALATGRAS